MIPRYQFDIVVRVSLNLQHLQEEEIDHGDVVECLLQHKNSPEMKDRPKCLAYVYHFETVSLCANSLP